MPGVPPVPTRDAVVLAHMWLRVDAAVKYGFLTGAPEINLERCEDVIAFGVEQGWEISDDEIVECFKAYLAEQGTPESGEPS